MVDVHVSVAAVTRATCQIAYLVAVDDRIAATAVTVHGCVRLDGRPTRLPDWLQADR